jgi:hypothetical protein
MSGQPKTAVVTTTGRGLRRGPQCRLPEPSWSEPAATADSSRADRPGRGHHLLPRDDSAAALLHHRAMEAATSASDICIRQTLRQPLWHRPAAVRHPLGTLGRLFAELFFHLHFHDQEARPPPTQRDGIFSIRKARKSLPNVPNGCRTAAGRCPTGF